MSAVHTIASCFSQMQHIVYTSALKLNRPSTHDITTRHLPDIIPPFHTPVKIDRIGRLNLDPKNPAAKNSKRKLFHDAKC